MIRPNVNLQKDSVAFDFYSCPKKWTPPLMPGNPVVMYQQGCADTCVVLCSAASAFAYFGENQLARILYDLSQTQHKGQKNSYQILLQAVAKSPFEYIPIRRLSENGVTYQSENAEMVFSIPRVATLRSADGGIGHAVAFCQNWIFDSNLDHALAFSESHLNWCCRGEGETGGERRGRGEPRWCRGTGCSLSRTKQTKQNLISRALPSLLFSLPHCACTLRGDGG